jgi:hypothetical protein
VDAIDPGFRIDGVATADLDLTPAGYPEQMAPVVVERVLDAVATQPGIDLAAAAAVVPLGFSRMGFGSFYTRQGERIEAEVTVNVVAGAYFETLGIPVRGRRFGPKDTAGAPGVVVVNERLAKHLAPDGDVLGGTFRIGDATDYTEVTVVGVTPDGQYSRLGETGVAFAYFPHAQVPRPSMNLVLRTGATVPDLERVLAAAIATADPALPPPAVQRLRDVARLALLPQRIGSMAAGVLGAVGLLLAALGVYGLLAGYVASHLREIGIRLALGAGRRGIAVGVLRRTARAVCIGALAGLALSAALARVLATQLAGVEAGDVVAFAVGLGSVLACAAVAVVAPLRRALKLEPMQALRHE